METYLTEAEIMHRIRMYKAANKEDEDLFKNEVAILNKHERENTRLPDPKPSDRVHIDNKK